MTGQQAVCGDCHGVVRAPRGMSIEAVMKNHKASCPATNKERK